LLDQAVDEHVVAGELREQPLDRDRLLKAVVPERVPGEHLRHAAPPEQIAEHVAPGRALAGSVHGGAHPSYCSGPGHEEGVLQRMYRRQVIEEAAGLDLLLAGGLAADSRDRGRPSPFWEPRSRR